MMREEDYKKVHHIADLVAKKHGRSGLCQDDIVHEFLIRCLERGRIENTDAYIRNGLYFEFMKERDQENRHCTLPEEVEGQKDPADEALSHFYLQAARDLVKDPQFQEVLTRRLEGATWPVIEAETGVRKHVSMYLIEKYRHLFERYVDVPNLGDPARPRPH